ncbi:hypothetical protein FHW88_000385 [Mucilaginibacter sp. SG538B]|nr:hypothetical protein [Mucilaginibacter sp. SG538B]
MRIELQNSNKKEYKHYFIENQGVNNFFWRFFFRKIEVPYFQRVACLKVTNE